PMKTNDSTFKEFIDKFTLPNSLSPGDDDSIHKKDIHEETFQIYLNPLFEFNDNFKSSNVNPLFEENDKDVKIKSSPSFTLTSPEESELIWEEFDRDSIPPGIDLTLPPTIEVSSSNPTSPTLTGEKQLLPKLLSRPQKVDDIKMKDDKVSSQIPIDTIVMPIRITFDNPIDLKKDLTVALDSTESSILPPPLLDSDSPFTAELSASFTLNSLGNEDKVFKPCILVYHTIYDKNLVTLEKNLRENISSRTLLVLKERHFIFATISNRLLPFYLNLPKDVTLLSFSYANEDKIFKPGIPWLYEVHYDSLGSKNKIFDPGIFIITI
ncbi:hypothetical protein Tco_1558162, partial [Tanacetum coccineum]